jgi:hypothetical protein
MRSSDAYEDVNASEVTKGGLLGDRAYALFDFRAVM